MQVSQETTRACAGRGLNVVALIGGRRIKDDLNALAGSPQVVVGTPGRVIDHLRRGTLRLAGVRVVVLDEADEMLDIGFADDIETILRRTPRSRQTALFSATMPPFIRRMINRYLIEPVRVSIDPEEVTVASVEQVYYEVSERDKLFGLRELLATNGMDRVLAFRRTQIGVDRLAHTAVDTARGNAVADELFRQPERERVMAAFRKGDLRVLIATNVAARGLDIPDVTHVVNFDLPQNTEEYVHRIGRTARAGRAGTAITFVGEWDLDGLEVLKRFIGANLRRGLLALYGGQATA
jgi:ATP-dependent RNA helicase DeaD